MHSIQEFFRKCGEFADKYQDRVFNVAEIGSSDWDRYNLGKIFEFNIFLLLEDKKYSEALDQTVLFLRISRILLGDNASPSKIVMPIITSVPSDKAFEGQLKNLCEEFKKDKVTEKRFINKYTCRLGDFSKKKAGGNASLFILGSAGVQTLSEKLVSSIYRSYIGAPVYSQEEAYFINFYLRLLELCKTPYYKLEKKYIDEDEDRNASRKREGFRNSFRVVLYVYNCSKAAIDCSMISLALKAYKAKYGGYPDTLGKLCPEFIDGPPQDPFSGKDFIYEKKDNDFNVYSVGKNGIDDKFSGDDVGSGNVLPKQEPHFSLRKR